MDEMFKKMNEIIRKAFVNVEYNPVVFIGDRSKWDSLSESMKEFCTDDEPLANPARDD